MMGHLSSVIQINEIDNQWMPLEEFLKNLFIQEDHMFQKILDIYIQQLRECYCGLKKRIFNFKICSS